MNDLYRHNGGEPADLPFEAYNSSGELRTDLGNHPESVAECGFVIAPPVPIHDPTIHVAIWDGAIEAWRIVLRPVVPPPPEVFQPLTPRQFFQALALPPYQIITIQEALDAVKTREIPAVMQDVIDSFPTDQQFAVTMILSGGQQFNRADPLVAIFGASQGMDDEAIDAFWRFASGL